MVRERIRRRVLTLRCQSHLYDWSKFVVKKARALVVGVAGAGVCSLEIRVFRVSFSAAPFVRRSPRLTTLHARRSRWRAESIAPPDPDAPRLGQQIAERDERIDAPLPPVLHEPLVPARDDRLERGHEPR